MAFVSFALDVVIAVLLVATIVYAVLLNRRLGVLRNDKSEFTALIARFNEATFRAEGSVHKLKSAAGEASGALKAEMACAQTLLDDLGYMTKRGGDLADRLEHAIGEARASAGTARAGASRRPANRRGAGAGGDRAAEATRSETERELLKAMQNVG